MEIRKERSLECFRANMQRFEQALKPHHSTQLITDQLDVLEKKSITVLVLTILHCIFSIFGYDLLSHLRAKNVEQQLFRYCEENQEYLQQSLRLTYRIARRIFLRLHEKTKAAHKEQIEDHFEKILEMGPPPFAFTLDETAPTDAELEKMGITRDEFERVHTILQRALADYNHPGVYMTFSKTRSKSSDEPPQTTSHRTITFKKTAFFTTRHPDFSKRTVLERHSELPFTVELQYNEKNQLERVYLIFKKKVGQGNERNVRVCYDPTRHDLLVRAKCSSPLEEQILRKLQQDPSPGLAQVIGWRKVATPGSSYIKTQFLQKLFPGDLYKKLGSDGYFPAQKKMHVLLQLAQGLRDFHAQSFEAKDPCWGFKTSVPGFHGDVDPGNILAGEEGCKLTDLGYAGDTGKLPCKIGFVSPAMATLHISVTEGRTDLDLRTLQQFNTSFAQPKDVWCLGMVFFMILAGVRDVQNPMLEGRTTIKSLAKLRFIQKAFSTRSLMEEDWDLHFSRILKETPQEEIYEDLDTCKQDCDIPDFDKKDALWNILKGMLHKDPRERLTAEQVFTKLQELQNLP